MRKMFEVEEMAHGKNPKLESLKKALHEKVIPRLLRLLETGGRSIQPCRIHSDIWPGNAMHDSDTYEVIIFDSCAYWGHSEADLGLWRASRYRLGRPFVKDYLKIMGISESQADWDDRNALYAMYVRQSSSLTPFHSVFLFCFADQLFSHNILNSGSFRRADFALVKFILFF